MWQTEQWPKVPPYIDLKFKKDIKIASPLNTIMYLIVISLV